MATARVVIKKYENRRLYDTSRSRYVNLDEIARMIRNGSDVQVVDAKTGEDVTRATLMQIVVEDSKDGPTGLPLELLRQLIVASDHVGKEFIMWYLKSAFDTYGKLQSAITSGFSEVQSAAMSPVDAIRRFMQSAAPEKAAEEKDSQLQELRQRIAELESKLEKPRARVRSRRKHTAKRR